MAGFLNVFWFLRNTLFLCFEGFVALFLSTHTNKVDKKGRVSVPASFRATLADQLTQGVVVFRSHQHDCLEGFDWAKMDEIGDRMDAYDLFSDEQDDLATTIFGESMQLLFDGEGRVVLPLALMEAAHIVDRATFVGLGRKFQIWAPELFEARKSEARSAVQGKKMTVPQSTSQRGGAL